MFKTEPVIKRTVRVAKAIGWVTFLEIIRDQVLYNIILCTVLLFGVGYLASQLMVVHPERVILDFGLSALAISSALIGVLNGSGLLAKEFDRRTIYVALCHPISKAQFILGKFTGLIGIILLNWVLLSGVYVSMVAYAAADGQNMISSTLFIALFLVLIQSVLLASISVLFSTFSTTSLSVILSFGVYLIGNNISQIRMIAGRLHSTVGKGILNTIATLLPNFEHFNIGAKVTYGLPVTNDFVSLSVLYGFFVITLCLLLAGILVRSREV